MLTPELPRTPKLTPVFFVNVQLKDAPEPVFSSASKDKAFVVAHVVDGTITTVPNEFGYELNVLGLHGADDITNHTSEGYNVLDCRLYGTTPEGAGVYFTYSGLIKLSAEIGAVLAGQAKAHSIEDSYVTSNPRVQFDDAVADKYRWAVKENLLGKGRFVRDEAGTLYVQYFVYVVR